MLKSDVFRIGCLKLADVKLIDPYNRHLNYLRISITDRCNLKCKYCVPRDLIPRLSHDEILTYEEILRLVRIGVGLGISKIRVTGGEPLARRNLTGLAGMLSSLDGIEDLSLSTNASLLGKYATELKAAGVSRINVSLDTLKPERFAVDRFTIHVGEPAQTKS